MTRDECIAFVLREEGGYVDHPQDPGGCTNRGITRATLSRWRGREVSCEDVRSMLESEARAIYAARYWNAIRGDDLPPPVALVVLDAAVNSGPGRAANWLQMAVGVQPDGFIGPRTLAALAGLDAEIVAADVCRRRLVFLRSLPTWVTFGKGWSARVERVRERAREAVAA